MRIRHEVTQQKDEEKRAAMQQLTKAKDDEMAAMKRSWENKVQDLLSEVRKSHKKGHINDAKLSRFVTCY